MDRRMFVKRCAASGRLQPADFLASRNSSVWTGPKSRKPRVVQARVVQARVVQACVGNKARLHEPASPLPARSVSAGIHSCHSWSWQVAMVWVLVWIVSGNFVAAATHDTGQSGSNQENQTRPNVILIMADDIGRECFGCYGSRQYRTPHIDAMAKQGLRFDHCYSQPLCTPSRVKLMTGLSNIRNYSAFSILNPDQPTIGHHFQRAGYATLVAGKWQLLGAEHYPERFRGKGTWPLDAGFDQCCLWQVDRLGGRYWQPLLYIDGENRQFDGTDDYGPEIVNNHVLEFISRHRDRPFFVYYPMILVHDPFVPSPDSENRQRQNPQANFEDMVHTMDKMVGRVMERVRELELTAQTLILFCGDNGTHRRLESQLGEQAIRGGKGKTTVAGMRVPLVAHWSGTVPAGRVDNSLIDFSDFLPTCLDIVGADIPDALDGHSFADPLRGKTSGGRRESIFCYYNPRPEKTQPVRFAFDRRWKLYGDGQMFDMTTDPLEANPLDANALPQEASAAREKLQQTLESFPQAGQQLLNFSQR